MTIDTELILRHLLRRQCVSIRYALTLKGLAGIAGAMSANAASSHARALLILRESYCRHSNSATNKACGVRCEMHEHTHSFMLETMLCSK